MSEFRIITVFSASVPLLPPPDCWGQQIEKLTLPWPLVALYLLVWNSVTYEGYADTRYYTTCCGWGSWTVREGLWVAYSVELRCLVVTASVQVERIADKTYKWSVMLIVTFQKHDCYIAHWTRYIFVLYTLLNRSVQNFSGGCLICGVTGSNLVSVTGYHFFGRFYPFFQSGC
jgi:hypothetical protein